ncbi:MAG: RNA polymerase sigma-70 factor [Candidatus Pedobacter colombiensis]|uniref:RNA polymerase sigma-70 factor n=1 Tax=Candidatus Pedobacter colombiensis TaxID=3121371 RepID=A0AAJ6B962_9SPHI|nr:RNA polymerase sigma-70 factor [Pedobacter sp.]WEK21181.1 MAG: RNA polymerase sigma-70 factor [Pedobacter sp.]
MKLNYSTSGNKHQQYDDQAFEQLFKAHFKALHTYANVILKDEDDAEEIVQNMFLKFWEKRDLLSVQTSLKAYLYKCVYHDSLNFLKHQKIKIKYHDFASYTMNTENEPASSKVEMTELAYNLNLALNRLPEQCRTIFQMSRFEELKYKEIADRLGLSIKTIENQMGKALRILRLELADYLTLILLGFMYYKDFFN